MFGLDLTGFTREQLRVQVSSNRVLKLSGQRKISEHKRRRFLKEETLSDSHDTSGISAKFEVGMLYVKIPKVIKTQPTQQEPPKPHQQTSTTTDDHKPEAPQHHDDKKDPKEDTTEESKIEEQPPPPQEPREMPQKEMSRVETEDKRRTSEAHEMHETTPTTVQEQKEGREDSEKKVSQSQVKTDNEKEMREVRAKAQGTGPEGLGQSSVAKMKRTLDMISDMVLEVKKQNKVPHLVVLLFIVLFVGLFKSVVKSSFGGHKNQEL